MEVGICLALRPTAGRGAGSCLCRTTEVSSLLLMFVIISGSQVLTVVDLARLRLIRSSTRFLRFGTVCDSEFNRFPAVSSRC
jgi:hypothetical protein